MCIAVGNVSLDDWPRLTSSLGCTGCLLPSWPLWAAWTGWRRRRWPRPLLFWALGAVGGLAAVVAMECGWVVTEEGRQPWVVYGLQTTAQAATTNGGVLASLSIVIVVYGVIGVATIAILLMLARRWRRDDRDEDASVPYGPPAVAADRPASPVES
jgi:cytochrome bd ubiquinol oxidase subunit I